MPVVIKPTAATHMQQSLMLTQGKVIEQTRLCKAVGLQVMPGSTAQVALVKIDVKNADDGVCLILLVCNLFVNFGNLEVIKHASGQHVTD